MSRAIKVTISDWPVMATDPKPIIESAIAAQILPGHHVIITGSRVSFMSEHGEAGIARLPWPAMKWYETVNPDEFEPITFDLVVPTHIVESETPRE